MYDGPNEDSDHIDLPAIEGDLQWLSYKNAEWGLDIEDCYYLTVQAQALKALAESSPHWNYPIDDDMTEDDMTDLDTYVFGRMIQALIDNLDEATLPFQYYGWRSDDPDADGYEDLGVFIDWKKIDTSLERREIISIFDPSELDDEEWRAEQAGNNCKFALLEDEGYAALYSIKTAELIWSTA